MSENKLGYLNLFVIVLSLYVLIALLFDTFFKLQPEVSRLLNLIEADDEKESSQAL